jgi:hypothetical protein
MLYLTWQYANVPSAAARLLLFLPTELCLKNKVSFILEDAA